MKLKNQCQKLHKYMGENKKECDICYQIKCKVCNWIANEDEIEAVQSGVLKTCPVCGWSP